MPHAIYTPRLNNNDDEVRLTSVLVRVGDQVKAGQVLANVETDKASVGVESDRNGYVLQVREAVDAMIRVGTVLAWVGDAPDEAVPDDSGTDGDAHAESSARPTAKALALIAEHRLNAAEVPARGARLTAS